MNVVAIPTLGKSDLLEPLLGFLLADDNVDLITVYDNGADPPLTNMPTSRLDLVDARGWPFYAMWNHAITEAKELGADYLAILNDDLRVPTRLISWMAAMLHGSDDGFDTHANIGIVCPDYRRKLDEGTGTLILRDVTGTYRTHGIAGFCFMVRVATCPLIDERYEIWFGDDDLVEKITKQGQRACIIEGLPIEHEESTTVNQCDWVPAAQARDAERWANRAVQ